MNTARIHTLLSSLDNAVDILAENRTTDAVSAAAFDTLKQARALVARAFAAPPGTASCDASNPPFESMAAS